MSPNSALARASARLCGDVESKLAIVGYSEGLTRLGWSDARPGDPETEFSLEEHVPEDHLLRSIDRFVDLSDIRTHLTPFYSHTGRPSVDPELMIRMLLIGYNWID